MTPQDFAVTEAFRGFRLDRFLQEMLPRMSRSSIQEAIATRVSLSSGAGPKPARKLVPGEVVTIRPRPARELPTIEVPVLVERDGWLVVNKPAGLLSVPGKGDGRWHNLSTLLRHQFPEAQVVHRLDQAPRA